MNDIEDLFNTQPPLSEEKLIQIITHLRALRAQHDSGIKAAKAVGERKTAADLEALGLGRPKPKASGRSLL